MRDISEYFIFPQDNAPAHRAKETVDILSTETPVQTWILLIIVWSVLQQQAYKVKVNNVDELHQRMQTVWGELDQCIIDKVIKQWRTHRGQRWALWAQTLKTSSE